MLRGLIRQATSARRAKRLVASAYAALERDAVDEAQRACDACAGLAADVAALVHVLFDPVSDGDAAEPGVPHDARRQVDVLPEGVAVAPIPVATLDKWQGNIELLALQRAFAASHLPTLPVKKRPPEQSLKAVQ